MPEIWRAMLNDGDLPLLGRNKKCLGVCAGPGDTDDINPDADGHVQPDQGGMSVSPSVDMLPPHRTPRRLRKLYPKRFPRATGPDLLRCWWMGEGPFVAGSVADGLNLRPDPVRPSSHGLVEPALKMLLTEYEVALAATQSLWLLWEEK